MTVLPLIELKTYLLFEGDFLIYIKFNTKTQLIPQFRHISNVVKELTNLFQKKFSQSYGLLNKINISVTFRCASMFS